MCGIVYVKRLDGTAAAKQVIKRYHKQESRGQEGFGYVADIAGKGARLSRFQFEHEVLPKLAASPSKHILFHHRYPTSAPNVPDAAHPIRVSHDELQHDYFVVHNGHIRNSDTLKVQHEGMGYAYSTEVLTVYVTRKGKTFQGGAEYNDSEALAVELARAIDGRTNIVAAEGAIAYGVLQVEKETKKILAFYYGTNGLNPLTISQDAKTICIASQGGKAIPSDVMHRLDALTDEVTTVGRVLLAGHANRQIMATTPNYSVHPIQASTLADLEEELDFLEEDIAMAWQTYMEASNGGESEDVQFSLLDDYEKLLDHRKRLERQLESGILSEA